MVADKIIHTLGKFCLFPLYKDFVVTIARLSLCKLKEKSIAFDDAFLCSSSSQARTRDLKAKVKLLPEYQPQANHCWRLYSATYSRLL